MYFATLFDKNYVSRAEVMIDSLQSHLGSEFSKIFILALDEDSFHYFEKDSRVQCVSLFSLEEFFPELIQAKSNRGVVEYIFTLSPFFPLYILKNYPEVDRITTLDSDLLFFSSPAGPINSLGSEKIGISGHYFPSELEHLEKFGKYNVSFQSFPNSEIGKECLQSWADDCIQFCGDYLDEQGRFADQKYLDYWQGKFGVVEVFPFPEIGLAPWNIHSIDFDFNPNQFEIDSKKVVFYHFQGFRRKANNLFQLGLFPYKEVQPSKSILKLYQFYLKKLLQKSSSVDQKISRLKKNNRKGESSILMELKFQPMLMKAGPFYQYLDLRRLLHFVEKKFNLTRWQE